MKDNPRIIKKTTFISSIITFTSIIIIITIIFTPSMSPLPSISDTDGDGYPDSKDDFPENPSEWIDQDGDGIGDNSDIFPNDPNEWNDTDGDSVGDNADAFPLDPFETQDSDSDGVGDNLDDFPEDKNEWIDSDGDGVGDNTDIFPDDPSEINDSDNDGIGDNADFFDQGNGGIRISLTEFIFEGYLTGYHRFKNFPDPWFQIKIDINNDNVFDIINESQIFNSSLSLTDFFSVTIDIADQINTIQFVVIAYDVWDEDNGTVTDFEIIDYLPTTGIKFEIHSILLPYSDNWMSSGLQDEDTPDCVLGFSFTTIEFTS